MKIGILVKKYIPTIIEYCQNNVDEFENLKSSTYCHDIFSLSESYPFFKKVTDIEREDQGIEVVHHTTNYRYWKKKYQINNEEYRVALEWYDRHKEYFLAYLQSKNLLLDDFQDSEIISDIENEYEVSLNSVRCKNIILYGVPGVGKTHNVNKVMSLLESNISDYELFSLLKSNGFNSGEESNQIVENISRRIKFTTFHQSFGYEDFIEGFRPNEEGQIALRDGIFKTICKSASADKDQNYYLVIDEINRGNISKIFGELITLIEEDKRDDLEVILPYSQESFSIPSNLYIIATMNSTDKSIALIDIALRRRFTFIKMQANLELVNYPDAKTMMEELNIKIESTLGKDYLIGHSYFMSVENNKDLEFVKEYKIKPLLEEYYYGDNNGLEQALSVLN